MRVVRIGCWFCGVLVLACGGGGTPAEGELPQKGATTVADVPTAKFALEYEAPQSEDVLGQCQGVVGGDVPIDELLFSPQDLAHGVPCAAADFDGDGAQDFVLARRETTSAAVRPPMDLLFVKGPALTHSDRVTKGVGGFAHVTGYPRLGTHAGIPAVVYPGEGGPSFAVTWADGTPQVAMVAPGD